MATEAQYRRIARLLEQKIRGGDYAVGTSIPSERELCKLYGVSRITMRHALGELAQQGLLTRRQGQGTFVAAPRIESSLLGYFSFSEALRAQGLLTSTHVLNQHVEPAEPGVAVELRVPVGAPVLHLVRLRHVDGDPFALETTWLPLSRLPGADGIDFAESSLYNALKERYGVYPTRARETFEPVVLGADDARAVQAQNGTAALLLLRTTYDQTDHPVELAHALIRGDRCRVLVELWSNRLARATVAMAGRSGRSGR